MSEPITILFPVPQERIAEEIARIKARVTELDKERAQLLGMWNAITSTCAHNFKNQYVCSLCGYDRE